MLQDRPALRRKASLLVLNSQPRVILVGFVYLLLQMLVQWLSSNVLYVNVSTDELRAYLRLAQSGSYDYEQLTELLARMEPPASAYAIELLLTLTMSIVTAGFVLFLLNTARGRGAAFGNLLDGFIIGHRIAALHLLRGALIFLGSLLLFVPGIVAAYVYSQALYLLLDDPKKSPVQCLRESRLLMRGHKMDLFLLDLSFLGWYVLAQMPFFGFAVRVWSTPLIRMSKTLFYLGLLGETAADRPADA